MKKKILSLLVLLTVAISGAWAQSTTGRSWDFTKWSEATVTNLKADAAASKLTGWSDVEKKTDAEANADPTEESKDKCFWYQVLENGGGELKANGKTITELKGLNIDANYATRRSLAIAVNYPETSKGTYAGGAYLWLGSIERNCFTIPNVKASSTITIEVESHNLSEERGIRLYAIDQSGANKIGEDFTTTTKASNTWEITTDCDVLVRNTNGCHIYKITMTEPAAGPAAGGSTGTAEFDLTAVASEYGTITFTDAGGNAIEKAAEGQTVTVTVTPATGYVVNQPSGQWIAAIAAARQRRASSIDLLSDIKFTPVQGQENQWTFTMKRANAEVSATYKKVIQASWIQDIADQTYNGEAQKPTVTVKDGSTVLQKDVDYTVSYSNNVNAALSTATNAPTVTITAVATSDTYAGTPKKTFTIAKATLNVKADDKTATFGEDAPTFTVTYDKLLGSDNAGSLGGKLAFDCSYAKGKEAKAYEIMPKGLTSDNYTINFLPGTLTVKQAALSTTAPKAIDGLVYNGKSQTLIKKGEAEGGKMLYSLDGNKYSEDAPTGMDAGAYTVYYKVESNDANHSGTEARTLSVRIARATLTSVRLYNSVLPYNRRTQSVAIGNVRAGSLNVPSSGYSVSGGTGIYPGDYSVTVSGLGNYQGTVSASFSITQADVNNLEVTLDPKSAVYDGKQQKPKATVSDSYDELTENAEYEVEYGANTEAGEGTVTIIGKGYYTGKKVVAFNIAKADVSVTAPTAIDGLVYTGKEQALVKEGKADFGEMLYSADGKEYGKTVPTGTDAQDYTIYYKVVADKNHNDTEPQTVSATIGPAKLTGVTLDGEALTYNRQEQAAKVKAVKAGELDVPAEGYTVGNNTATEAGTYTLTVTGQGNYTGELTADFTIGVADAAKAFTIALDPETFVYDGTEKQPKVTVRDGSAVLVEGTDYAVSYANNLNAGEAKVTVTGQGNYSGKKEQAFAIGRAALTDVTINPTRLTYNREAQTVNVTGVKAGKMDVAEADYTVSGNTQTSVGTYTVTVTAREGSNFEGEASTTFTIQKADLSVTPPTAVADLTYNGEAQELVTKGSVADGKMLYSLDGKSFGEAIPTATDAGQYVVYYRSEGDDNYNDYADNRVIVNIGRAALTEATLNTNSLTYNGLHQTVEVIGVKAGKLDVPKEEYLVSDNSEKLPGEYAVTVRTRFNSNFQGSLEVPFTIKKAQLTSVVLAATELYFNGEEQTVGVKEVKAGEMDVPAASYSVSGNTQTEAGTYTVTVTANENSNFTGSATAKFSITRDKDGIFIEGLGNVLYTVTDQAKKKIRLDKLAKPAAGVSTRVTIPARAGGYEITALADGFLGSQTRITDIYLPDTQQPIAIGKNALPGTARIHVTPALLDDYAMMASLQQNVEGMRLSATITPANRYWTFSSRIDVVAPEGVTVNGCRMDGDGTKAVITRIDDTTLTIDGRRTVKAYNGVLMIGIAGATYELVAGSGSRQGDTFPAGYDAKSYGDWNQLVPVVEPTHFEPGECYVLKDDSFHPIAETESEVHEGKAVLKTNTGAGSRSLAIVEDSATEISLTPSPIPEQSSPTRSLSPKGEGSSSAQWYDLQGRMLNVQPTKPGLYIKNGRKQIIK